MNVRAPYPLLVLALLLVVAGCGREPPLLQRNIRVMGDTAYLTTPHEANEAMDLASQALRDSAQRLYPLIDIYSPESEISRANQIAFRSRFPISRDTQRMLEYAKRLSTETAGSFDISDATIRHVWVRHFRDNPSDLLPEPLVRASRVGVGAHLYEVSDHSLLLLAPETQLDLNEFARAYIIDLTIVNLRRMNLGHVLIEMGDVGRALGHASPTKSWSRPIPHPTEPDEIIGTLTLTDGNAYALLGWPHHYTDIAGKRVSRIIDPRTGWPAQSDAAVVVTGPVTADAYALAQSHYLRGREQGAPLMRNKPRYNVLFIEQTEEQLTLWMTPGLVPLFVPKPEYQNAIQVINLPQADRDVREAEPDAEPQE